MATMSISQIGPFIRLEQEQQRARGLVLHPLVGWRLRSDCNPVYLGSISDDLMFMEGNMQCSQGYKIPGVWEAYRDECAPTRSLPNNATPLEP